MNSIEEKTPAKKVESWRESPEKGTSLNKAKHILHGNKNFDIIKKGKITVAVSINSIRKMLW